MLCIWHRGDSRSFTGAWIETLLSGERCSRLPGRSFTGAWIETMSLDRRLSAVSRSFTGAWIETKKRVNADFKYLVAPSRERGLKLPISRNSGYDMRRSFTGAWIETRCLGWLNIHSKGRSFTGAWIETGILYPAGRTSKSRSFTGAWIETSGEKLSIAMGKMSLLHGSVD